MAQVDEKLKELQSTLKGLVFKPSTSKARKKKQNKRKGIKRKLRQDGECKNKSSAKGFTKGQPWQRWYDYWVGRHFHCSISKFIKKGGKGFTWDTQVRQPILRSFWGLHFWFLKPPSLALSDSESPSDSDSDQWHYFNNQSVLTKLLFNSFFQIFKIVVVVVI